MAEMLSALTGPRTGSWWSWTCHKPAWASQGSLTDTDSHPALHHPPETPFTNQDAHGCHLCSLVIAFLGTNHSFMWKLCCNLMFYAIKNGMENRICNQQQHTGIAIKYVCSEKSITKDLATKLFKRGWQFVRRKRKKSSDRETVNIELLQKTLFMYCWITGLQWAYNSICNSIPHNFIHTHTC